jgi:hypothetical protein
MQRVEDSVKLLDFDTLKLSIAPKRDMLDATIEIDGKRAKAGMLAFAWTEKGKELRFHAYDKIMKEQGVFEAKFSVKLESVPEPQIIAKTHIYVGRRPDRMDMAKDFLEEEMAKNAPTMTVVRLKLENTRGHMKTPFNSFNLEEGKLTDNLERAINEKPQVKEWVLDEMGKKPGILH